MRDVVFIGHATPEDNDFTLWLQAKLKNEGYNCECDLSFLLGGEADYWNDIQEMITERAIKYILVLSNSTFNKSGVLDEWEHCRSLEKPPLNLKDFIIPVKIDDDVAFNVRIGLNRRNIIPFQQWGIGLKKLLRKLEADGVPKTNSNSLSIHDWYENVYTTSPGIDRKTTELFFSNWLPINQLPPQLHLFKFENNDQAEALEKYNKDFPTVRHGNYLATFSKTINIAVTELGFDIPYKSFLSLETDQLFDQYDHEDFPTYQDFRNLIVRLLRAGFDAYLKKLGLHTYEYASKTICYFFPKENGEKAKGEFELNGKKKSIGVHGKHLSHFWHFGISFHPTIYPRLCYSLRTHIVFTEDGVKPVESKDKQHSLRRAKGKMMFNAAWRDQVLAFAAKLVDIPGEKNFEIMMSQDDKIKVETTPITFQASFGYNEPNDESRLKPVDDAFGDEEFYDDMEKQLLGDA